MFWQYDVCRPIAGLIGSAVMLPCCQLRTLHKVSYLSVVSFLTIASTIVLVRALVGDPCEKTRRPGTGARPGAERAAAGHGPDALTLTLVVWPRSSDSSCCAANRFTRAALRVPRLML